MAIDLGQIAVSAQVCGLCVYGCVSKVINKVHKVISQDQFVQSLHSEIKKVPKRHSFDKIGADEVSFYFCSQFWSREKVSKVIRNTQTNFGWVGSRSIDERIVPQIL